MTFKENYEQITWECIHFGDDLTEAVINGLRGDGIAVYGADLEGVVEGEALLEVVAKAMRFPDYFGMNWNALDECLSDMSWDRAAGHVLVLSNVARLWAAGYVPIGNLISAWLHAAEIWSKRGLPFHLVFRR